MGGGRTIRAPWNSWRLHVHLLCVIPTSCSICEFAYTFINIAPIHVLWMILEWPFINTLSVHDVWSIYKWWLLKYPLIHVVWMIYEWSFINVLSIHVVWMFLRTSVCKMTNGVIPMQVFMQLRTMNLSCGRFMNEHS